MSPHSFENSSNLASAEYDPETKKLTITFKSGGSWSYADVPQETFDGLLAAESAGKYYFAHIKSAFTGSKVQADG